MLNLNRSCACCRDINSKWVCGLLRVTTEMRVDVAASTSTVICESKEEEKYETLDYKELFETGVWN